MRIHFLGTGGAEGIPAMGCECDHCRRARAEGGRLVRRRTAVLFSLPGYELLMDTPPDIRELLDANGVQTISGIFITHEHFDHSAGLEEFLYWQEGIDLFAEAHVYQRLMRESWAERFPEVAFHFAFRPGAAIRFSDFSLIPLRVRHTVPCFGLALHEGQRWVVHISDSDAQVSNYVRNVIAGADVLIVNTPFFEARAGEAHMSVEEAIALKEEVGVKRLIVSHANHHNHPHDELEAILARYDGVTVAYDGMTVDV